MILSTDRMANCFFSQSLVSMEPRVGLLSSMKLSRPVRMVLTDQAGFQVSGW